MRSPARPALSTATCQASATSDNRQPFRPGDPAAIERYRNLLRAPDGAAGIDEVAKLVTRETVALPCLERE
jgi:hypothetical protein